MKESYDTERRVSQLEQKLAGFEISMEYIKQTIQDIKQKLDMLMNKFETNEIRNEARSGKYNLSTKIVFGAAAAVLLAFLNGLILVVSTRIGLL